MLAGRMKLKNFLALVVAAVVLLGMGGVGGTMLLGVGAKLVSRSDPEPPPLARPPNPTIEPAPVAVPAVPVAAPAAPTPVAEAPTGRAAIDAAVMSWVGRDLGASKKKDVTKGRSYKLNVYQDDGHATANRAKLDLDRDDSWDEKLTFDDGTVSRKVAPADDEDYTESYVWDGSAWQAQ